VITVLNQQRNWFESCYWFRQRICTTDILNISVIAEYWFYSEKLQ
jgi:hypothetical protein